MKEQAQLFKIIADFLEGLSEEELQALLSKKAKLSLEMKKGSEKESAKEPMKDAVLRICPEEVCARIDGAATREEASAYLEGLSTTKAELKAIAKRYGIPLNGRENNAQIREKIVENTVGSKIKFDTLLHINIKK